MTHSLDFARRALARHPKPDCFKGHAAEETVLLFAAEPDESICKDVVASSRKLKRENIIVATANIDPQAGHVQCLRLIASSARYFFELGPHQARNIFSRIPDCGGSHLRKLTITENIAPGMRFIPGSASPAGLVSADGRQLSWTFTNPAAPLTLHYRVQAQRSGALAVGEGTELSFLDNQLRRGTITLPPARITVLGGIPIPGQED